MCVQNASNFVVDTLAALIKHDLMGSDNFFSVCGQIMDAVLPFCSPVHDSLISYSSMIKFVDLLLYIVNHVGKTLSFWEHAPLAMRNPSLAHAKSTFCALGDLIWSAPVHEQKFCVEWVTDWVMTGHSLQWSQLVLECISNNRQVFNTYLDTTAAASPYILGLLESMFTKQHEIRWVWCAGCVRGGWKTM